MTSTVDVSITSLVLLELELMHPRQLFKSHRLRTERRIQDIHKLGKPTDGKDNLLLPPLTGTVTRAVADYINGLIF